MCGLLGYIGYSKDPKKTELLTTTLFEQTQIRGMDAAGYYCTSDFTDKKVFYNKQSGPSYDLIKSNSYKRIWENSTNLGLFHCRAASAGVGPPSINKNNHPFVSMDFKKAIIHNGLINKKEYFELKNHYETETECDSEIILRILEQEDKRLAKKIENFISSTENSSYAIAYAENHKTSRRLTLFRNEHRPLYYADLTADLGQIFFFSTIEIFLQSLDYIKKQNVEIRPNKIVNIIPSNVFVFEIKEGSSEIKKTILKIEKKIKENNISSSYKITNQKNTDFFLDKDNFISQESQTDLICKMVTMYQNIKKFENNIKTNINYNNIDAKKYNICINSIDKIIKECNYISNIIEGNNYEFR